MLLSRDHVIIPGGTNVCPPNPFGYPERVLQIGEGRFLRAFADWIIHRMNSKGVFRGRVVVAAPRVSGRDNIELLNRQDGLYTVWLRGIDHGDIIDTKEIVTCVSRGIDPSNNWREFLSCAENPNINIIISNTTEAGLEHHSENYVEGEPLISFPARLTAYLFHRYRAFSGAEDAGVTILPCELVEDNGDVLKSVVIAHAIEWNLPSKFIEWLSEANKFCNTLVDRIVTGFPEDMDTDTMIHNMGYEDELLTVAEPFYLWAIEGDKSLRSTWPAESLGLNVHIVNSVNDYRVTKLRILNGAHTAMTYLAMLFNVDTVRDVVVHPLLGQFIRQIIYREIIPSMTGFNISVQQLTDFADRVWERFQNPFIRHEIRALAVNGLLKVRIRLVPSLLDYSKQFGTAPPCLAICIAAVLLTYGQINVASVDNFQPINAARLDGGDAGHVITEILKESDDTMQAVERILSLETIWGINLNTISGLTLQVSEAFQSMESVDVETCIRTALDRSNGLPNQ